MGAVGKVWSRDMISQTGGVEQADDVQQFDSNLPAESNGEGGADVDSSAHLLRELELLSDAAPAIDSPPADTPSPDTPSPAALSHDTPSPPSSNPLGATPPSANPPGVNPSSVQSLKCQSAKWQSAKRREE